MASGFKSLARRFKIVISWAVSQKCEMVNKNMVGIRLYDGKTIDTSSAEMKEKVSKAVAEYVINNWDDVAKVEREGQDVLVYVTL